MGGSARPASASAAGLVQAQRPQVSPRRRPRPSSMRPARVPRRTVRLAGISPMRRLCSAYAPAVRSALPSAIDPAPCALRAISGPLNASPVAWLPPPPSVRPSVANGRRSRRPRPRRGRGSRHPSALHPCAALAHPCAASRRKPRRRWPCIIGSGKPPADRLQGFRPRRPSKSATVPPVGRINAAPVHPLARGTASRASVALGRSSRAVSGRQGTVTRSMKPPPWAKSSKGSE